MSSFILRRAAATGLAQGYAPEELCRRPVCTEAVRERERA
jgi:hypothetical protein